MIYELDKESAAELWPQLATTINAALVRDPYESTSLDQVGREICEGRAKVLIEADQEGDVRGVVVTQLFSIAKGNALHVLTLTGRDLADWLAELIDELRSLARRNGATIITMTGRPGWVRKLARFGFRTQQVRMTLEVEQ